jgi:hypothetical protein
MMNELNLPWRVVQNWRGKIALVDATNNGEDTVSGRICNLPRGKDDRGLRIAKAICDTMNAKVR